MNINRQWGFTISDYIFVMQQVKKKSVSYFKSSANENFFQLFLALT